MINFIFEWRIFEIRIIDSWKLTISFFNLTYLLMSFSSFEISMTRNFVFSSRFLIFRTIDDDIRTIGFFVGRFSRVWTMSRDRVCFFIESKFWDLAVLKIWCAWYIAGFFVTAAIFSAAWEIVVIVFSISVLREVEFWTTVLRFESKDSKVAKIFFEHWFVLRTNIFEAIFKSSDVTILWFLTDFAFKMSFEKFNVMNLKFFVAVREVRIDLLISVSDCCCHCSCWIELNDMMSAYALVTNCDAVEEYRLENHELSFML